MNVALRQLNRIDAALEHTLATLRDQHGIVIDDTVRKHHDRRLHTDHTSVSSSEGLCIVLVKYGTKYGPEYVNRLAYGLYRHHNKSIVPKLRVICFTDDIRGIDKSIIECRGLGGDSEMAGWSGWWYKACIFSSAANLPAGRIAYIDLDTIVVGDWSFLAMVPTNSSNSLAVCEPDVFLVLSAKSLSNTEGWWPECFLSPLVMFNIDIDQVDYVGSILACLYGQSTALLMTHLKGVRQYR